MANNGGKINFQVGFNVDKTGLSQMQSSFQKIITLAAQPGNQLDDGLQKAAQTASVINDILSKTFNSNLGTLNVSKFNQELQKSGLTLREVQARLENVGVGGSEAYNRLTQAVLRTNLQIKQSNKMLDEMFTTLKNTIRYGISSSIVNNLGNSIQQAYSYAKKLDTSLNDIRIVTDKSADSMAKFAQEANVAAKSMGASTLDYANASLIYYQQGLSDAEVAARTETTIKAANVTAQTGEEVSEQLTAVWNGYKVTAEETEAYVDKLAAVAATTAADLEELSVGMSKVASAANAMGVDFDDLNAQIATIVSVTRQAPESVGTALKTIYARLGDLKVDGVDEFGVSLGEVSSQLQTMGIQILDQQGNLRDMTSVIAEVADKWGTWTEAQRQAAAVAMAGKRQYNNLIALFDNWDMYTSALETSTEAMGTLQHQQDIYMESTAAKLKTLKAAWQGLYDDAIDEEEINEGIELLTNLVEVFDNFISSFGGGSKAIIAFGSIVANVFSKQISGAINTAYQNLAGYQNNLQNLAAKKDALSTGMIIGSGDDVKDRAVEESLNREFIIAEQIEAVRKGLTDQEYNELMVLEQEVGQLVEKKTLEEENIKILTDSVGLESEYQQIMAKTIDEYQIYSNDQKQNLDYYTSKLTKTIADVKRISNGSEELKKKTQDIRNILVQAKVDTQKINQLNLSRVTTEDALQKKVKDIEQILKDQIGDNEKVKVVLDQIARKKETIVGLTEQEAVKTQEIAEKIARAGDNVSISKTVTSITSGLSSISMAWMGISSLIDTIGNKDISIGDKITQSFMALSFVVPGLISSFSKLNAVFATTEASSELLGLQASKAALSQNALTISNKVLNKTYTEQDKELLINTLLKAGVEKAGKKVTREALEEMSAQKLLNLAYEQQIVLNKQIIAQKAMSFLTSGAGKAAIAIAAVAATIAIAKKAYEAHEKKVQEANEQIIKNAKEVEEQIKVNKELYDSYNELYSAYDKTKEVSDDLYEAALKLAEAYDIQGGRVLALSGKYDILAEKAEKARLVELETQISEAGKAASAEGQTAIRTASKNSRGFRFGSSYNFYEQLQGSSIREAAVKAAGLDLTGASLDIRIDYTDPQAVKDWKDQVDAMVEYYNNNVEKEIRTTDYFYNDLIAEQKELAENSKELIDQLNLQYSGMVEEAVLLQKQNKDGIQLNLDTTVSDLATLKENLRESLKDSIPEKELEDTIDTYLSKVSSIEDAYSRLQIAEEINKKFNEGSEEGLKDVVEQVEKFNNDQLAFLEIHLDTALLSKDLNEWVTNNQSVLDALGLLGTSTGFKDVLANYDTKTGFTGEQTSVMFGNEQMQDYLPSQSAFDAMDEGDRISAITQAWIESTKAALEYKQAAHDTLVEEQEALKEDKAKLDGHKDGWNSVIRAQVEGYTELEYKTKEIDALAQKLTEDNAQLSDEEIKLLKTLKEKTDLDEENLKNYGSLINEIEEYDNAINDYGKQIDEVDAITKDHATSIQLLSEVTAQHNVVLDNIQASYKSLMDIVDEYNESGSFTIDMVQQLMTMDDQYVATLQFEGNQLSINEQAFQALTLAKIDDLEQTAVLTAQEELERLAEEGVTDASLSATSAILNAAAAADTASEAARAGAAAWDEYAASMRAAAGVSGAAYDERANQITDALRNRLLAAENARSQIKKGGTSMRSAMGAPAKSSGSGKEKKEKELKELKEEFDRYWEIKKAIDAIDKAISKLDKDQENLFGKELIRSLKQENALLAEQAQNYERLAAAQREEAGELQGILANSGVAFDASGAIINYAQATAESLQKYNEAVKAYNAGLLDDAAFKIHEKAFEEFKKNLERYDNLFYKEMQETQEKLDEIRRKQLANNLKAWEVEIQLKLDWKQLERDWNDFLTEISEDFKSVFKDLRVDLKSMLTNAGTYTGAEGTIGSIVGAVKDVTGEIDKMMGGGSSSMFESVSQAQEKLKELNSELLDSSKALHDLWKHAWENYLDGIDQVSDAFDKLLDRFERINDELEFQNKLIELLYGDEAYGLMSKLYEGQERNAEVQLQSLKSQVDMWKELFDASGATMENQMEWSEDQQKYYDNWIKAQSSLNDLVIEYIELLKKDYMNTISDILKQFETFVTSGSSLSYIGTQWERISANADKYYDSVEGAYQIQTLANKIDESIANSNTLKVQQKLMALREKEITYLREKETLTEYDIKAAEMRYQIALKEIALEDAQQNKTAMKLTRNEQGNWSYQYVADEQDIATKRQELLDMYNDLYQLASDAYEANLNSLQELQQKYIDSAKEIYENENITEEERQQQLLELREWYLEQYRLLSEENQLYRNDLATSGAALLLEIYEQDQEAYQAMTENERELVDALINANIDDYMELEDRLTDNYQNIGDKAREVMANTRADWTSGAQTIADLWNKNNGWSVKTQVISAYDSIQLANQRYKEAVDWCAAAVERNFGPEGIVGAIQNAEYETDSLRDKTVEMVNTAVPYLQELRSYVDQIEDAWRSVQQAIIDAINLIEEYLRKVGEARAAQEAQIAAANAKNAEIASKGSGGSNGGAGSKNRSYDKPDSEVKYYYSNPSGASGTIAVTDSTGNIQRITTEKELKHKAGWINVNTRQEYATGGYTGTWVNGSTDGRWAVLHQKELVLNENDTKNFLSAINTIRDLNSGLNHSIQDAVLNAVARTAISMGGLNTSALNGINNSSNSTENVYNITAEFPNAENVNEIREAILSLPNLASQYINSTLK